MNCNKTPLKFSQGPQVEIPTQDLQFIIIQDILFNVETNAKIRSQISSLC